MFIANYFLLGFGSLVVSTPTAISSRWPSVDGMKNVVCESGKKCVQKFGPKSLATSASTAARSNFRFHGQTDLSESSNLVDARNGINKIREIKHIPKNVLKKWNLSLDYHADDKSVYRPSKDTSPFKVNFPMIGESHVAR
jgi:hypothetical protein